MVLLFSGYIKYGHSNSQDKLHEKKGDMRRICLEIVGFHARQAQHAFPSILLLPGGKEARCMYADEVDLESTGGPECTTTSWREIQFNLSIPFYHDDLSRENHLPDIETRILIFFYSFGSQVTRQKKNHTAQLKNISRRKQEIFFFALVFSRFP